MAQARLEPASAVARRLFGAIGAGRWLEAAEAVRWPALKGHGATAFPVRLRRQQNPQH